MTSTVNGYGSDFAGGNYVFDDAYTSSFWTAANITGVVPVGNYFPSGLAGARTALTSPFAALTSVTAAGTWTLKITDSVAVDTGTLNSASVDITEVPDADGDGTSDALDGCPNNASLTSPRTYYVDADGDGYGTTSTGTSCSSTAPAGYSSVNTDCNDSNAAIKPTATEVCDLVDNNCDGSIDEGVKTTYYRDADGDGYGTAGTTTQGCSAPTGYVASSTDCNDANSAIRPGATEICDGIDQDCDGAYDNGFADADGDTIGDCADTGGWTGLLAGGTIPDNGFRVPAHQWFAVCELGFLRLAHQFAHQYQWHHCRYVEPNYQDHRRAGD